MDTQKIVVENMRRPATIKATLSLAALSGLLIACLGGGSPASAASLV